MPEKNTSRVAAECILGRKIGKLKVIPHGAYVKGECEDRELTKTA